MRYLEYTYTQIHKQRVSIEEVTRNWGMEEMGFIVQWVQSLCLGYLKILEMDSCDRCITL